MKHKLAVIGALGTTGRALLNALASKGFSPTDIYALDYRQNEGCRIPFQETSLTVRDMMTFDFKKVSVVLYCLSSVLSEYLTAILDTGAYLIDCIGITPSDPCIIPTLNITALEGRRLILNPTSLTAVLARFLSPLHQAFQVRHATAVSLLSTQEFGASAVQALVNQSCVYDTPDLAFHGPFHKAQAFNLIPEVYPFLNQQTAHQIKSLLHFPIGIHTCLTPVVQGECHFITFSLHRKASLAQLSDLIQSDPSCCLIPETEEIMPLTTQEIIGTDNIYLTHFRAIPYRPDTFCTWLLCDSRQTGNIANAIQIIDYLLS